VSDANEDPNDIGERWLAAELNRMWFLAERALRAFQKAQIRPQPNHPSMAEVEMTLSARRAARYGRATEPEDEQTLSKALAEVEQSLGGLRKAAVIGRLTTSLQLRPLEIETLVTVVAPHLDAPLADIFSILRGASTSRRGVDLALITTLFRLKRADRVALLDVIDPERALLHWRLIQILPGEALESYGSMSHRALRPTFDLISILCRSSQLAPELGRSARLVTAQPKLDDLSFEPEVARDVKAVCEAARNNYLSSSEIPWLVFYGLAGSGKREVAARLAAYGGRSLIVFDPSLVTDKPTFDDIFLRTQREALIRNAVLYVGPVANELLANGGRDLLGRLAHFAGPVVIGVDALEPPRLVTRRPLWELALRLPSESTRVKLWDSALPSEVRAKDVRVDSLARSFNLTPGEIGLAANEAIAIARREGEVVSHRDVRDCVGRRLRNDLGEFAKQITVSVKWSDLVLPQDQMDRVHEFISRKKYSDRVYKQWGYGERLGYGKGLIALFSGPPGTGKTMLAGLIARSLDLDLYQVDLAQVVSKWVGETEKQLAKVFDQAERAHAVLLFDEADSLFAKRTEVKSSNDRYGNMATNYLLQRLEQYSGIAVLTTNKDASLDEALQRRLSLHLFLEIPEVAERERLWRSFMPERAPVAQDVDFHTLATEFELSGGYIKNAALRAAFLAASHDAPINMVLLRVASALELEDMGHVVWHRSQPPPRPADDIELS
jgi:DNA replication protein DnaC